jgi:hypothetical protein
MPTPNTNRSVLAAALMLLFSVPVRAEGGGLEDENGLQAVAGPDILVLRTPVELHGEDHRTVGEFSVAAGETVPFVLSHRFRNFALRSETAGALDG